MEEMTNLKKQKYQLQLNGKRLEEDDLKLLCNVKIEDIFDEQNSLSSIKSLVKEQLNLISELFVMKNYYEGRLGLKSD